MCNQLGIRFVYCNDWLDFINKVRCPLDNGSTSDDERIFRGHAEESYKLASSWERILLGEIKEKENIEKFSRQSFENDLAGYFERFKALAIGLSDIQTSNLPKFDLWALGRHHGLVTPILDWTTSPYIAMFFAAEEHINRFRTLSPNAINYHFNGKGYLTIWELTVSKEIKNLVDFEVKFDRVDQSSRQKAQKGLFSWLTADKFLKVDDYLASRNLLHLMRCYKISKANLPTIISDLNLMNINHGSLYPDLHGAAMQASINPLAYYGLGAIADAQASGGPTGFLEP